MHEVNGVPYSLAVLSIYETDMVVLELDNGYVFRDFDYDEAGQVEYVISDARVIAAHWLGNGKEVLEKTIFGPKKYYEVTDGSDIRRGYRDERSLLDRILRRKK